MPRAHPQLCFLCSPSCAFFPSKPPEGMAWPSSCERGCCLEGPVGQGLWTCWWLGLEAGLRVESSKPNGCCLLFLLGTSLRSSLLSEAGVEDGVTGLISSPLSWKSTAPQILNVPCLENSSVLLVFVQRGREGCYLTLWKNRTGESWGVPRRLCTQATLATCALCILRSACLDWTQPPALVESQTQGLGS